MNAQKHIEQFNGLQVNKEKINDKNRMENHCASAEKYQDTDEANQAEIEDENGSKNYCVMAERYRDEDESKESSGE